MKYPPWYDNSAWRELLSRARDADERRRIVRQRALLAGAVERDGGEAYSGEPVLELPILGLDPDALGSLTAQAMLNRVWLRVTR
jgi:hypothetical protein